MGGVRWAILVGKSVLTLPSKLPLLLCGLLTLGWVQPSAGKRPPRSELPRFRTRLQLLSGVTPALLREESGGQRVAAVVPLDLELATRLDGPLSLLAATVSYLAPFSLPSCADQAPRRPHALASLLGVRLDLRNSRDGSWWSPWVALRMGVVGQAATRVDDTCQAGISLSPTFSPRLGADLWMGQAAATFAVGYDYLPTGSALAIQVGLTLRLP